MLSNPLVPPSQPQFPLNLQGAFPILDWRCDSFLSNKGIELNNRDFTILKIIYKFRFSIGKHIKILAGFSSQRSCDRRLKKLLEAKYIQRKRYFYGFPYIYTLSHKGRMLLGVNKRAENIRLDQLSHDICVVDCAIYFLRNYDFCLDFLTSEKELHSINGFSGHKHTPDFVLEINGIKTAYEIELTPKKTNTLENNVKVNYLNFDNQIWITDNKKVKQNLEEIKKQYEIQVVDLKEVMEYVNNGVS